MSRYRIQVLTQFGMWDLVFIHDSFELIRTVLKLVREKDPQKTYAVWDTHSEKFVEL